MDHLSASDRSALMAKIGSRDTKPEIVVRRAIHRLGHRFRLHRKDLPGTPDLVLPRHRLAVFVHGCFWHRHPGCKRASTPATNGSNWMEKFERNRVRDAKAAAGLDELGWRVLVIWECETRSEDTLRNKLSSALTGRSGEPTSRVDKMTVLTDKSKGGGVRPSDVLV